MKVWIYLFYLILKGHLQHWSAPLPFQRSSGQTHTKQKTRLGHPVCIVVAGQATTSNPIVLCTARQRGTLFPPFCHIWSRNVNVYMNTYKWSVSGGIVRATWFIKWIKTLSCCCTSVHSSSGGQQAWCC